MMLIMVIITTFLAPGTGFVEDNFSTDGGWRGMVQVVRQAMGKDGEQQMKLCSIVCRSPLLCSQIPNRSRTSTGPGG